MAAVPRALETTRSANCRFDGFEDLSSNIPSLQHQMFRLLSKEISHDAEMMALLGRSTGGRSASPRSFSVCRNASSVAVFLATDFSSACHARNQRLPRPGTRNRQPTVHAISGRQNPEGGAQARQIIDMDRLARDGVSSDRRRASSRIHPNLILDQVKSDKRIASRLRRTQLT